MTVDECISDLLDLLQLANGTVLHFSWTDLLHKLWLLLLQILLFEKLKKVMVEMLELHESKNWWGQGLISLTTSDSLVAHLWCCRFIKVENRS